MKAELQRLRTQDPKFTFSGDGVHPNGQGHLVMAKAILAGLTPPVEIDVKAFGDPNDPTSKFAMVQKLVRQRGRVLIDAWLTDTGHKRPMNKGLPMAEAAAKAAEIEKQIEAAVQTPPKK
jgi:phospholipase/lecithinase/hemolysin